MKNGIEIVTRRFRFQQVLEPNNSLLPSQRNQLTGSVLGLFTCTHHQEYLPSRSHISFTGKSRRSGDGILLICQDIDHYHGELIEPRVIEDRAERKMASVGLVDLRD